LNPVLFMQGHDRLLPIRQPAHAKPIASLLANAHERPNLEHPHAKQLFNRMLDLRLRGPEIYLKGICVVVRELVRSFFRDQGLQQNLMRLQVRPALFKRLGLHDFLAPDSLPWAGLRSCSSAARVKTSRLGLSTE